MCSRICENLISTAVVSAIERIARPGQVKKILIASGATTSPPEYVKNQTTTSALPEDRLSTPLGCGPLDKMRLGIGKSRPFGQ